MPPSVSKNIFATLIPTFGSVSLTFTQGGGYSQTVTAVYRKIYNTVTMRIPNFGANATANDILSTGSGSLPDILVPLSDCPFVVPVRDGGATTTPGLMVVIASSKQLKLYKDPAYGNFVSGSSAGSNGDSIITYHLD